MFGKRKNNNVSRKVDQKVIDLLKKSRVEIGFKLPIDEHEVNVIYEWFTDKETMLSVSYVEGDFKDKEYLDTISRGVDDFFLDEDISEIDLEDLNRRMKE